MGIDVNFLCFHINCSSGEDWALATAPASKKICFVCRHIQDKEISDPASLRMKYS